MGLLQEVKGQIGNSGLVGKKNGNRLEARSNTNDASLPKICFVLYPGNPSVHIYIIFLYLFSKSQFCKK